jgi:UDP-GlcNAc3NAcA epimerase
MLKVLTVIGARPQIIKAAALSRAIRNHYSDQLKEIIVHTGQHYDENMSQVFFEELQIPRPDYNLQVGSLSHGKQTAAMISGIEDILLSEKPGVLVLYGDTNSTLAGSIAASKLHIPVVHVEAGLRSFNKAMPEEINRILADHVSTLLFSPTKAGIENLLKEGFPENSQPPFTADNPKIYHCGDIMYDNSIYFSELAEKKTECMKKWGLEKGNFILATVHRDNNTDNSKRLSSIFKALLQLSHDHKIPVVLPLHPRTSKLLEKNLEPLLFEKLKNSPGLKRIPPASFLEMTLLEKNCRLVLTDSGGVQKEACFFKKPCVILRSETEWVELVESGCAIIADADQQKIEAACNQFSGNSEIKFPAIFGDGKAAEFICGEILRHLNNR